MTSYELFYGKRFFYLYLQIFGCAAYILDSYIKKIDKLAVRLEVITARIRCEYYIQIIEFDKANDTNIKKYNIKRD
jgi:hypothetical protein